MNSPDSALRAFLVSQGLASAQEPARWHALAGGVSSDIWRVDLPGRQLCIKRALARLKVSADWQAPVSRNAYEWAWMEFASCHAPDSVPRPLAHDPQAGLFAMSFLAPEQHPVWKEQLMAGNVSTSTARAVGHVLGELHAASAGNAALAAAFDTTDNFRALRLEPYLVATAQRHPMVCAPLMELAERTAGLAIALVHGDISPKNILVGPRGPVLLDAECAWYGDPAFDLAFCLNHLMLKCLVRPDRCDPLLAAFSALNDAYFDHASWEPRVDLEARAARLLPALLLARIDGKSPVEYVSDEAQKEAVRAFALPLVLRPVNRLSLVARQWGRAVAR
ncbi:MAG TPA: aminoglycoside phosphotransferase family protein [Ramlibacter sp.]|nr:aminoglycoside phosphotransferase family protein [Ramlibacter sp.]